MDHLTGGFDSERARPVAPSRRALFGRLALAASLFVLACRTAEDYALYDRETDRRAPKTDGVSLGVGSSEAQFVTTVASLRNPESVRYDPEQDVYFISNMSGYGSVKDGDGYIVRVSAADVSHPSVFIRGGTAGVTLDAPKGMTISGDTLWVADIDKLRGFHRITGAPLATVDFAPVGAVLLNDVAARPGAELRVTDTGIRMDEAGNYLVGPARIFAIGPGAAIRTVTSGSSAGQPNGITWDATRRRWVVVSFDRFHWDVTSLDDADSVHTLLSRERQGQLDGVEVLASGGILYSSWADSSLHVLEEGRDRQVIRKVVAPADIGVDTRRHRVAIPLPTMGWVQIWSLGDSARTR